MATRNSSSRKKSTSKPATKVVPATPPPDKSAEPQGPEQLLTFVIGENEYGISILRVREIAEYRPLTPVPMTPPWMRGVMNLRGTVVPVVDLGAKLGFGRSEISRRTCLVIVEIDADGEQLVTAVMVDGVRRVVDISPDEVQETPPFGLEIDFVRGMVKTGDDLMILLDLPAILASAEIIEAAGLIPAIQETAEIEREQHA